MIQVEYTIEPFVEGDVPERVTRTAAALEGLGLSVEIGVFGSSFMVPRDMVGRALQVLADTAYAHGATHLTIDLSEHA